MAFISVGETALAFAIATTATRSVGLFSITPRRINEKLAQKPGLRLLPFASDIAAPRWSRL
jgi:hypothetical protein